MDIGVNLNPMKPSTKTKINGPGVRSSGPRLWPIWQYSKNLFNHKNSSLLYINFRKTL